jgi:hypothetical protein
MPLVPVTDNRRGLITTERFSSLTRGKSSPKCVRAGKAETTIVPASLNLANENPSSLVK